ncbi:hypothetical protein E4U09_005663 [Claviceps aff. purpurea]|uniref:Uncharacterized protein n=1 Tax=Claviceps aff. purpurea TaxID=1967640 RepID=A0A9P7QBT3_9HYPO|nr:hypothetical protein E4U09_005663 [Claviceps aff. purpurea]
MTSLDSVHGNGMKIDESAGTDWEGDPDSSRPVEKAVGGAGSFWAAVSVSVSVERLPSEQVGSRGAPCLANLEV